ncbi:3523_t:CDS:2, partial [Dentiscutata heterogama]
TPKYSGVVTIQKRAREVQGQKLGQERGWEGRKQSKRTYKGRDCKNGHKFSILCLILSNQKGYGRQDCTSGSPIRHF